MQTTMQVSRNVETEPAASRPASRLTTLPTEILDVIAFHVGRDTYGEDGRRSLRSLLLTSKAFVSSALRMLYRQFLTGANEYPVYNRTGRAKSYSLRTSLVKYPEYARAVRDLSKLYFFVNYMHKNPTTAFSSAIDQAVEPWAWQEDLVRLCTGVTKIGLLLRDAEYAASIGKHLEGRPMLAYIRVAFPPTISRHSIHPVLRDFAKGLGGVSMPRIDHVEITPGAKCHAGRGKKPHYNVRKLTLNLRASCFCTAASLLPKKLSAMRILELVSVPCEAISPDLLVQTFTGNVLTEITWTADTYNAGADGPKEEYQEFCRGQVLPKAFFGLFPHLRRLSLTTVKELDVEKLSTLAEGSPGLQHLALTSSYWTFAHTDFDNVHPSLSPAETSIVGALDRFKKLKSVDLGILPFTDDHVLSRKHDKNCRCGLRQYAKSRKIKLLFEGCPSMEELEAEEEGLYYLNSDLGSDGGMYDSDGFLYGSDGYSVDLDGVVHGRGGWFIDDRI